MNLRLSAQRAARRLSAFLENALHQPYVLDITAQWSDCVAGHVCTARHGQQWGLDAHYRF